jgi:hypothetical protein
MAYVLLMVPAADDNVVHPGKSCVAISDGPVHVLLEGWSLVSEVTGHPLVLEKAEGRSSHILLVDRNLMVPFLQVNLGENCAAGHLGGKIQHVGQRVTSRSVTKLSQHPPSLVCGVGWTMERWAAG